MSKTNLPNTWTKRATFAIAAFAIVAAACSGATGSDPVAHELHAVVESSGRPVPTTTFSTFEGETVSLASYTGRPLVVNFWASWCPSCVAEMSSAFKPVQQAIGDQVTFLGVNIQDERVLADELLATTGVEWISAEDPEGALYVALGGLGMPFTIFVSAAGDVLETHNGPLSESQLRAKIDDLLVG